MAKYLLDTSVIIEALRLNKSNAIEALEQKYQGKIYLSSITVTELFSGKSAQDKEIESYLTYLIRSFHVLELEVEIAIAAGKLRAKHNNSLPDAIIAASAISNNLILITHNKKDYQKIPGLTLQSPRKIN